MPPAVAVFEDAESLSWHAAELMQAAIVQAIADRGAAHVALSGGTTPGRSYRLLGARAFDRALVHWYWVDERAVPPTSDRSNYALARQALLDPIGVPTDNVHRMPAELTPLADAAARYAVALPGLDLLIAGIGPDGHTASLFPHTGAVRRDDVSVVVVEPGGGLEPRLSLSRTAILGSRRILVLATGSEKRSAVAAALEAGDEDEIPARLYRRAGPGCVTFLLDRSACP
jgi:6-phosphogluconolactonase